MRFLRGWESPTRYWPEGTNLNFVPNPNSPSGTVLTPYEIELLADELAPAPLVLDEAYADFADWNALQHPVYPPNLIITRTLSKSYSLSRASGVRLAPCIPDVECELVKA